MWRAKGNNLLIIATALVCSNAVHAQTKVPAVVDRLVSLPSALPAGLSDRLAEEAKAVIQLDGRGQLPLDREAAQALVDLGLTSSIVTEVNVRMETATDRWGTHQDIALPGTPPDYKHTAIVYISEDGGALDFPTLNTSVPFTKGGVVAFPAGLEHGVVSAGPRIMLGPFSDAMTEVGVRTNCIWGSDCTTTPTAAPTATPTAPPTPVCAAVKNARKCRTAGCTWTRNGNAKFKSCVGSGYFVDAAADPVCTAFNVARKCRSNAGCVWARKGANKFKSCTGVTNVPTDLGTSAAVGSICGSATKYRQCRRNAQCHWVKTGIDKYKTCQPIAVAAPTLTPAPTPAPTPFSTGVCNAWVHHDGCCRRDYADPQRDTGLSVEMLVLSSATKANAVCATKCCAHSDCTAYELTRKKAKGGNPVRFRCELHADKNINSASTATKSCKSARCEVLVRGPS